MTPSAGMPYLLNPHIPNACNRFVKIHIYEVVARRCSAVVPVIAQGEMDCIRVLVREPIGGPSPIMNIQNENELKKCVEDIFLQS